MEISGKPTIEQVSWGLAKTAFGLIEIKYGASGDNPKPYHGPHHTKDVVSNVTALADLAITRGKLDPRHRPLLVIAAAYHDIEQGLGSGPNEVESASQAKEAMRSTALFTPEDEKTVEELILRTQVFFDGGIMHQVVDGEDYPGKLIADADLSNLGRETPFFWDQSVRLYEELYGPMPHALEQQLEFIEAEVLLLKNHEYHSEEAKTLYTNRPNNLIHTEAVLAALTLRNPA